MICPICGAEADYLRIFKGERGTTRSYRYGCNTHNCPLNVKNDRDHSTKDATLRAWKKRAGIKEPQPPVDIDPNTLDLFTEE